MNHNGKFLSVLLILLGVLFSCTQAPQQIAKETITSVGSLASAKGRGSTVQIRLVRASGELAYISSGFFVARDKIATNLNKAIADFNEAIKLNSEYTSAYSNRGYTKIRLAKYEAIQGNVNKARRHYQAAIEDCTKAIKLSSKYAKDSLMRVYAKILLEPENVDTYKNRGDARFQFGEFEASQGNAAQAKSHYRTAVEDYTSAIDLKSDWALAYYNRGLVKQALRLQEEAQADFEEAKKLNSDIGK